jgi:hypothetical protein
MSCLTDYIGIRVCSTDEAPGSGLYINSLPGLSLESIDAIADQDQTTYRGVWADAQDEAYQLFIVDFFNELMNCYRVQPYCDYEALICNNKKLLAPAWKYLLGAQLMQYRIYTPRLNYFTTVTMDDAPKLLALYQVEYEKSLSKALKLIDVRSCCLECGGNPETVVWLP